jgi:hypothetical protein
MIRVTLGPQTVMQEFLTALIVALKESESTHTKNAVEGPSL